MSPHHAFVAWQLLNLVALGAATWIVWPSAWAPTVAVLFYPVMVSFRQAQDAPLFMLALAISYRLIKTRPILAGVALAFLGIKFQLILLIPVFFLMKRAWKMGLGFALGVASLIAACFAFYGTSWLSLYPRFVLENQRHLEQFPALDLTRGLSLEWFGLVVALAVALAILLTKIEDIEMALCAAVAIGLLAAPHFYAYDFTLALPLVLLAIRRDSMPAYTP